MLIKIKARTGITANNIPSEVFTEILSIDTIDGDVVISCNNDCIEKICEIISNFYDNFGREEELIIPNDLNGVIEITSVLTTAEGVLTGIGGALRDVPQPHAEPRRQMAPGVYQRLVNINPDIEPPRLRVPQPEQRPFQRPVEAVENGIDPEDASDEGEMKKSDYKPSDRCIGDDKLLIAAAMKNVLGSNVNLVKEKVTELNRLLSRTLALRNEIDIIMKPVESNDKVNLIINQIKGINDSITEDSLLESAYINKFGNISILTKHLYTEKLEDNTIRDIGEMEIVIVLEAILRETVSNHPISPIIINNLTHYFEDGGEEPWCCGHVPYGGSAPCFGHVFEQIDIALRSKNILMAIELIIKYIRNPNIHDGWGCKILGFPVVQPETAGDAF